MDKIFQAYWEDVFSLAMSKTGDPVLAEEITQDIFVSLWESRCRISIKSSLKHYLMGAVKFKIINHYKSNKIAQDHHDRLVLLLELQTQGTADEQILYKELNAEIEDAISSLPGRMGLIFNKSRMEGKSPSEIATEMNLSVQTVKNQTTSALKLIKERLPHLACFL